MSSRGKGGKKESRNEILHVFLTSQEGIFIFRFNEKLSCHNEISLLEVKLFCNTSIGVKLVEYKCMPHNLTSFVKNKNLYFFLTFLVI